MGGQMENEKYIYYTKGYETIRIRANKPATRLRPPTPASVEAESATSPKEIVLGLGKVVNHNPNLSVNKNVRVQLGSTRLEPYVDCVNTEREGDSEPILMCCCKIRQESVLHRDRW